MHRYMQILMLCFEYFLGNAPIPPFWMKATAPLTNPPRPHYETPDHCSSGGEAMGPYSSLGRPFGPI